MHGAGNNEDLKMKSHGKQQEETISSRRGEAIPLISRHLPDMGCILFENLGKVNPTPQSRVTCASIPFDSIGLTSSVFRIQLHVHLEGSMFAELLQISN